MNQTNATSADLKHVVCPHCHTTNRVATVDLGAAPTCGKCHQPLFTGHPLALDEAGFARHVSRSHLPVLVDFWAPGAAPAARWPRTSRRRPRCWSRMCAW